MLEDSEIYEKANLKYVVSIHVRQAHSSVLLLSRGVR